MKIVIIGGSGLIGAKTVERLRKKGHEVVAASPKSGVNTITGEGLADALKGADVVVDLANCPSFEDKAVIWNSSRPPVAICTRRKQRPASDITSRCRWSKPSVFRVAATFAPRWLRRT